MPNPVDHSMDGSGEPAKYGFSITPSDNNIIVDFPRALFVGGAGNVAVEWMDGTSSTFVGVPAGSFLPIRPCKVKSTGTTATSILGVY